MDSEIKLAQPLPDRGVYRVCVDGVLEQQWLAFFEGFEIAISTSGQTCLTGEVQDQAALHGLLRRIRDLGLPLLRVQRMDYPAGDSDEA